MNYKHYVLLACCVLLVACGNPSKKQSAKEVKQVEKLTKELPVGQASSTKRKTADVAELQKLISKIGFLELPYRINFSPNSNFDRTEYDGGALDGVLCNTLIGVLPDTSKFYGFIEVLVASIGYPVFVTFDKSGVVIDENSPPMDNCYDMVKEYLYCNEYIEIQKDLSLHYYYGSKYTLEKEYISENEIIYDTICERYEKRGRIKENGAILFDVERTTDKEKRIDCD